MSSTTLINETRCHNPRGCVNQPRPGYNFCDACRLALGMISKPRDKQTTGYAHPIVGLGEAGQTHLQRKEATMKQSEETKAKRIASMKKTYAADPRAGVFFSGWLKDWLEAEAAGRGMSIQQYVRVMLMERVPAEVVKAGMLAEMGGE